MRKIRFSDLSEAVRSFLTEVLGQPEAARKQLELELAERGPQPDVLVKGSEYADRVVVGRELVEAGGGCVKLVPLLPEVSTTDILSRIRNKD